MNKGKIKAVLFLIVFLLMLAIICNLLLDLTAEKNKEPDVTTDPYAATIAPQSTAPGIESLDPVGAATASPAADPAATSTPMPTPTATPEPTPTPLTTPTPAPANTVLGSGEFSSATGVALNVRALWTASVLDDARVTVTVDVYLDSYQLFINEAPGAVNVSVGDQYATANAPKVAWDKNEKLETHLGTTTHVLDLANGQSASFPLAVEYHFNGEYSKVELPVIECGGNIALARG